MRILSKKQNGTKKEITWVQGRRNDKLMAQAQLFKQEVEDYYE